MKLEWIKKLGKNSLVAVIIFLTKIFLFFIFFFIVSRSISLLHNHNKIKNGLIKEMISANIHGFTLDISSTCYFLLIITFLLFVNAFVKKTFITKLIHGLNVFLICLYSLINVVDMSLIDSWGTKINTKALSYLSYPATMFNAISGVNYVLLITVFIIQSVLFVYLYIRYIKPKSLFKIKGVQSLIFLPLLFIIFIGLRGGLTGNAIGKSAAVYSDNSTLNLCAINSFWNFSKIIVDGNNEKLSYNFFTLEKANNTIKEIFTPKKDSTLQVLKNNRPNIVIILLESFCANEMLSFGGKKQTTPFIDSISQTGIVFNNLYAAGFRTEQGFVALLSGFPSQPKFSIQRESGKIFFLPMLSNELANYGYNMDFYYGGDMGYARTDEYLKLGKIEKLYSKEDYGHLFEDEKGVYDEFLFSAMIEKNRSRKEPFFTLALTSATHGPFYYRENIYGEETDLSRYENSLRYTDNCLKDFFREAKKTDWFKNTLVIILADHTHGAIGNYQPNDPKKFKIPFMLIGDVIKEEYRGKRFEKPTSQIDISSTLLKQLNMSDEKFEFSRDMFNPNEKHFGFYTYDNGFGYVDEKDTIVYDCDNNIINRSFSSRNVDTTKLNIAKSFLQVYMQRFADME